MMLKNSHRMFHSLFNVFSTYLGAPTQQQLMGHTVVPTVPSTPWGDKRKMDHIP